MLLTLGEVERDLRHELNYDQPVEIHLKNFNSLLVGREPDDSTLQVGETALNMEIINLWRELHLRKT
jgi:hypothetical protein